MPSVSVSRLDFVANCGTVAAQLVWGLMGISGDDFYQEPANLLFGLLCVPTEHRQFLPEAIRNAKVASSIPASGTIKIKHLAQLSRLGFLFSGIRCSLSAPHAINSNQRPSEGMRSCAVLV